MAVRASWFSSSLNGLKIAITIFMGLIPAWARSRCDRAVSTEVHHAERVTTRAQPTHVESNAVPDRAGSLTDYQRAPFRGLRRQCPVALLDHAQSLATPA